MNWWAQELSLPEREMSVRRTYDQTEQEEHERRVFSGEHDRSGSAAIPARRGGHQSADRGQSETGERRSSHVGHRSDPGERTCRGAPRDEVERVTATDGTDLALHRLGPDGGAPVVLVPGAFSDHRFWLGTRETGFGRAAAERGFSVWVLDPRGHGASERPGPDSAWRFRDWIRHDVPAAVRAATGAGGRAVVVAHSAGGAAALAAAAFDPETAGRIRGIAALSTPSPNARPFRRGAALVARLLSTALGRFPARALGLGGEDELGGVMAEWMGWNAAGAWRWPGGPDLLAALRPAPFPVLIATGSGSGASAAPRRRRALFGSSGERVLRTRLRPGDRRPNDFGHFGLGRRWGQSARILAWGSAPEAQTLQYFRTCRAASRTFSVLGRIARSRIRLNPTGVNVDPTRRMGASR